MIQKIIRVGNSAAITIPKDFMKKARLQVGDEISIETNSRMRMFLGKPKEDERKTLTPEFKQWLDSFIKEYQPILKKLARL